MVKAVLFEAQGGEDAFPAGARALLRWFQSGRNRLGRIKKEWPVSNWHGGVMVQAVLFEAQGGEDRFPPGPRTLLRWSQSGRNRLGRIKKCVRSTIGTVVSWSRLCCSKPKGTRIDSRLGRELFYVCLRMEETD